MDVRDGNDVEQKRGKVYFINNVNTLVGQSLVEEIRNDHLFLGDELTHTILGTRCETTNAPIPSGVNKVVKKHKIRHWKKYLLGSDVMVFDLLTSSFDEVSNAIHVLKTQDYDEEKVLVLISSVVTWVNTPPNRKPVRQVEESTDTESEVEKEIEVENAGVDEHGQMVYPFEESDFHKRVPSPKYQSMKTLENTALAAMKNKDNLKVYVLCAGILYGNGEDAFYNHFKQAWAQKLPSLPVIGSGDNIVPTIHIKDLSNIVKRIAVVKPHRHYSFAIDRSINQTQVGIVQAISRGVGSGQLHNIELDDVVFEDWAEFLTLNIRMRSSDLFEELVLDEPEQDEPREFNWHCQFGIRENIEKINEEFNMFRNLSPMRIYINGPPASGKSYYGSKLGQVYDIPHIRVTDIVDLAGSLEGELGDEIRKYINTKKDETMEEHEKTKKKGQELHREDIVVRLPDKYLHMLAKIRLSENICRNKGFILDGFPRTYLDCYHTFYNKKNGGQRNSVVAEGGDEAPVPEGEKPIDWENDYEVDTALLPKLFIQLTGEQEGIKARVKGLPEDKLVGSHWNDADLDRRNAVYAQNAKRPEDADEEKKILSDFFKEHNIKIVQQNCLEEEAKVVENLKQVIQSNFDIASMEEPQRESDHEILQRHLATTEESPEEETKEDVEEKQKEEAKAEEAKAKSRLDKIKEQERELLDTRSQPIRQYLMDNVVPLLTEGLIKICKEMPDRPIGELADFLLLR